MQQQFAQQLVGRVIRDSGHTGMNAAIGLWSLSTQHVSDGESRVNCRQSCSANDYAQDSGMLSGLGFTAIQVQGQLL